jgi:hypothetical protein
MQNKGYYHKNKENSLIDGRYVVKCNFCNATWNEKIDDPIFKNTSATGYYKHYDYCEKCKHIHELSDKERFWREHSLRQAEGMKNMHVPEAKYEQQ